MPNSLDPDQAQLFCRASLALLHCVFDMVAALCHFVIKFIFRLSACGYGTVNRQNRGNKEKKCNAKKNEKTK